MCPGPVELWLAVRLMVSPPTTDLPIARRTDHRLSTETSRCQETHKPRLIPKLDHISSPLKLALLHVVCHLEETTCAGSAGWAQGPVLEELPKARAEAYFTPRRALAQRRRPTLASIAALFDQLRVPQVRLNSPASRRSAMTCSTAFANTGSRTGARCRPLFCVMSGSRGAPSPSVRHGLAWRPGEKGRQASGQRLPAGGWCSPRSRSRETGDRRLAAAVAFLSTYSGYLRATSAAPCPGRRLARDAIAPDDDSQSEAGILPASCDRSTR